MKKPTVIGIDFGTSGCRAVAIDLAGKPVGVARLALPAPERRGREIEQSPLLWAEALERLLDALFSRIPAADVHAIALDGTSGSVLLADAEGAPLTPALMYNDNRAVSEAALIATLAPRHSAAHGTGSGLAKLLWLLAHHALPPGARVHSQADWLSASLSGRFGLSDANNMLKLGYDPVTGCWPAWMGQLGLPEGLLPQVLRPGTQLGPLRPELAARWGLPKETLICTGTTDSTAAFIASGAREPGEAVTSLGSTLVLKVISDEPVFAPEFGVYSQPLGNHWLVGGSSNSGGAVLRHFFSDSEMARLSEALQPDRPSGLDYYPLNAPGERFPRNDPGLLPRLEPRPADDVRFFQGLLEGIARIEKEGYDRLAELGAPYPVSVRSNGGGGANAGWTQIRGALLGVPMLPAREEQACYGSALLALRCPG
jgi:hypothetical protein